MIMSLSLILVVGNAQQSATSAGKSQQQMTQTKANSNVILEKQDLQMELLKADQEKAKSPVGAKSVAGNEGLVLLEKPISNIPYDPSKYPAPDQGGDAIASATVITAPYSNTGTTSGYLNDYDEVCPYTGSTSPDVVYSYTPSADEAITVDLLGSLYDTKVFIYQDVATPGTPWACNDDAYPDYTSALFGIGIYVGHTYYIVIDGYGGDNGTYTINVTTGPLFPPPYNDECAGAIVQTLLDGVPATFTGNNLGATQTTPSFPMPDVWEAFTLTGTATVVLDYCTSGAGTPWGNAWLNLALDCPVTLFSAGGAFETTTCPDGNVTITWAGLAAGTYYYPVMLDAANNSIGDYTLHVVATYGVIPTGCENTSAFGTATVNPAGTLTTISTCSYAGEYSTVNGIVAGETYQFTMSDLGTGAYITITDGAGTAGNILAYGPSPLNYVAAATGTLYAHWSLNEFCAADASCHTTTVQCMTCGGFPPPVNDNCAAATAIGEVTDLPWETNYATFDGPGLCMTTPNVWYNYTSTVAGDLTVDLCGSSFDTKLTVYDSFDCGTMVSIECNDDFCGLQSSITILGIAAGAQFKIEVGGYGTATGTGDLTISVLEHLDHDVSTQSIDNIGTYIPTTPFAPQATVFNNGINTESFNVTLNITDGYTSTMPVASLAPGASAVVTFATWTPGLGTWDVSVCTQLGTDMDLTNDCQTIIGVTVSNLAWGTGSAALVGSYLGSAVGYTSPSDMGYLYAIGGNTVAYNELSIYDVVNNTWSAGAVLPGPGLVAASAVAGDKVYHFGGADPVSGLYLTNCYAYDIATNVWSAIAPLPVTLGWPKAVGYGTNYIYVAGGVDGTGTVVSTVYLYDVALNTWTTATSLPAGVFGGAFSLATGTNTLVYAGGADISVITATTYVGEIDPMNPASITWTTGTAYPGGPMYRFDGAPWCNGKVIMGGGSPSAAWVPASPNPSYVYEPATDTWTAMPNLNTPTLGAFAGSVMAAGGEMKFIIASGYDGVAVLTNTQILSDVCGVRVFGNVYYGNIGTAKPMATNTSVTLTPGSTVATGAAGYYEFAGIADGAYRLYGATTKAGGGITTADGITVARFAVGIGTLTNLQLRAADVNKSNSISTSDGILVKRRAVGLSSTWAAPVYVFDGPFGAPPSLNGLLITVAGVDVTQEFRSLCSGDVNGSFTPAAE